MLEVIFLFTDKGRTVLVDVILFIPIIFFFLFNYDLKKQALRKAKDLFKFHKKWMKYSPEVLLDIENKKYYYDKLKVEIETESILNEKLSKEDKSIFINISLSELIKKNYNLRRLIISLTTILIYTILNLLDISPFDLYKNKTNIITEDIAGITPKNAFYFYGQTVDIRATIRDNNYKFIGFEIKKENSDYTLAKENVSFLKNKENLYEFNLKIPVLTEEFSYRAVFLKGIKKLYSKDYKIEVEFPAYFKDITFLIIPPKYTGMKSYSEKNNYIRAYYGSRVKIEIKTDAIADLYWNKRKFILEKKENKNYTYSLLFFYENIEKENFQFHLISMRENKKIEQKSPVYEIWTIEDIKPKIKIRTSEKNKIDIYMPQKGVLKWNYSLEEDFNIKEFSIYIFSENKINKEIPVSFEKYKINKEGLKIWEDELEISVTEFNENKLTVIMGVRDNSLIPNKYFWQKNLSKGQTSVSVPIEVHFPDNVFEKNKWEDKNYNEMVLNLESIKEKYSQSEKEIAEILKKSLLNTENTDETEKALKDWTENRQNIKEQLEKINKQLNQNISTEDITEKIEKEEALENIKDVLSEQIAKKEKELSRLMKELPQDYIEAQEEINEITQKEYLESLKNSLARIKKLLAVKKISQIEKMIENEIKEISDVQKKLVFSKEKDIFQTEKNKIENINSSVIELQKLAEQYENEINDQISKINVKITPDEKLKQDWNKNTNSAINHLNNKQAENSISDTGEMILNLRSWLHKLDEEKRKIGTEDTEKALTAYYKTAYRVNDIARVLEESTQKNLENKVSITNETIQDFGKDVSILKDSYLSALNTLIKEVKEMGMIKNELNKSLNAPFLYYKQIQESVEKNLGLSAKNNGQSLKWKLNSASLSLLKEMGKMRMQMAKVGAEGAGEKLNQAMKGQKELSEQLKELSENESQKSQQLSDIEKAYINEISKRQNEVLETLKRNMAKKEFEETSALKEMQNLADEINKLTDKYKNIKTKNDTANLTKEYEKINEKFIRYKKSLKNKNEVSHKREAEKPLEYIIKEPHDMKIPEKKKSIIPIYDENFSDIQKIFFENYIKNLEEYKLKDSEN
ncbi:MAG: hypothetical protein OEZ22_08295 [Spirochaetia bacterium]|nr:hypothetical protein [Spirochaetia bacterium]